MLDFIFSLRTHIHTFLSNSINECISGEEQVKQIIKYIKSKREVKFVPDIKRTYKQTV